MKNSSRGTTRRGFLATSAAGFAATRSGSVIAGEQAPAPVLQPASKVRVISSANGLRATQRAHEMIEQGKDGLEACIAGVNLLEDDPEDTSVGYGGLPNEEGVVQLDAAVMHGPTHQAGAVAALEGIRFPSRVAYAVMRETDHVLLVGAGALRFARAARLPRGKSVDRKVAIDLAAMETESLGS